ncbi:GNAT family N-acetyltransferase [Mangrovihabitans endophyticus]|uniref:GNAT family N-acetyltransferase n=1 Tax=Mangrovihabitans endophyticus TaxID=1751298 RepID=UPI00166DAF43|nr:GNAT family N-acetyltransferase [Mangrovihabitans endophyticus]
MEPLTTSRLVLREFVHDDHAAVHAYASDPDVAKFIDWGPNTPAETTFFLDMVIAAASASPRIRYALAAEHAGAVIGAVELRVEEAAHRRGSMGYVFARPTWGQGLATEAAGAVLGFAFDHLGLHKVSATCDPHNSGSVRVLEKIGMSREGHLRDHFLVHGRWRDRLLWAAVRPADGSERLQRVEQR